MYRFNIVMIQVICTRRRGERITLAFLECAVKRELLTSGNVILWDEEDSFKTEWVTDWQFWQSPGIIVKVALNNLTQVANLTLGTGENTLWSAAISPSGDYAYFGTFTVPGRIVKVALSTFTHVGGLTLNSGEDNLRPAAISPLGDYAYLTLTLLNSTHQCCQLPGWTVAIPSPTSALLPVLHSCSRCTCVSLQWMGTYTYWGTAISFHKSVRVEFKGILPYLWMSVDNVLYKKQEGPLWDVVSF